MTDLDAVDPDIAICHNAVEENTDLCVAVRVRNTEVLPIPAHSSGKKRPGPSRGAVFVERVQDAPVVWNIYRLPFGVI